jgi:hypothetical protein
MYGGLTAASMYLSLKPETSNQKITYCVGHRMVDQVVATSHVYSDKAAQAALAAVEDPELDEMDNMSREQNY